MDTIEELLKEERRLELLLIKRDYSTMPMATICAELNAVRRRIADINYKRMVWENDEGFYS